MILGCFFADLGHGSEAMHIKGEFDLNFWLALAAATGVPAFAWWMVRNALASVKESLTKTITVELCKANQATCQKEMAVHLGEIFAPKELTKCVSELREKREVTHARIYDEIRSNREAAIKEMKDLTAQVIDMTRERHESLKKDVTDAILIHAQSEAPKPK